MSFECGIELASCWPFLIHEFLRICILPHLRFESSLLFESLYKGENCGLRAGFVGFRLTVYSISSSCEWQASNRSEQRCVIYTWDSDRTYSLHYQRTNAGLCFVFPVPPPPIPGFRPPLPSLLPLPEPGPGFFLVFARNRSLFVIETCP